jgi:general secretion pathway protein C
LLAPLPIAQSPPAPDARAIEAAPAGNPFKPLASAAPIVAQATPEAVETSLDLTLHGTWAEGDGRGTAVIQASGAAQKVFKIGDEICCGAKLEEVYADRVIISRAGAREALLLPNSRSDAQTMQASPHAPAPVSAAPVVSIQAVDNGQGVLELRLFPYQDPGAFEALGLRPGDILVSVDGVPAGDAATTTNRIATLSDDDVINLSVKRDGVEFPIDVSLADWRGSAAKKF